MLHNQSTFLFSKGEIVTLAAYMSRDGARVNLAALHFDTNRGRVFATDGHRLICATRPGDDASEAGSYLSLPADVILTLAKTVKARQTLALTFDREKCVASVWPVAPSDVGDAADTPNHATFSAAFRVADVHAPPVNQVIPRWNETLPETTGAIGVHAAYIGALGELCKVDKTRPITALQIFIAGPLDPMLAVFEASDDSCWRVVIMPVRVDLPTRKPAKRARARAA